MAQNDPNSTGSDGASGPENGAGSENLNASNGRKRVRIGNNHFHVPGSVWGRRIVGVALILGGVLGFLPVLGFWMVPLGLVVLSVDSPYVRRHRRTWEVWAVRTWNGSRLQAWWHRLRGRKSTGAQSRPE